LDKANIEQDTFIQQMQREHTGILIAASLKRDDLEMKNSDQCRTYEQDIKVIMAVSESNLSP
jgi:hypothetical protein